MPEIHCSENSMCDEKITITVTGLKPSKVYTINASTKIENGAKWVSFAQYKANENGCIDVSNQESIGGSYLGVDSMGLFWSMKQSKTNKWPHKRFAKMDVTIPLEVTVCVYNIVLATESELLQVKENAEDIQPFEVARKLINRWYIAKDTKRIPLRGENGLWGCMFIPPGKGPFPSVIAMFGVYPVTTEFKAALLSSHGFVTIALRFLGEKGLPEVLPIDPQIGQIRLEYFEKAVDFLVNHPSVDASRGVGVITISYSTCISLAMAEFIDKVKAVVWINGLLQPTLCDIFYKDKVLKHMEIDVYGALKNTYCRKYIHNMESEINAKGERATKSGFRLNFQNRFDVAYMFVSGLDDKNSPSEHYLNYAEMLLKEAKHPNYHIYRYPGTGHLLELPYGVHNELTTMKGEQLLGWGGTAIPHCRSQEDTWLRQITFLRENIGSVKAKF
uniref:Bile acid-CoA:amino acid N-acyltransferase n=1 Tax=Phallusia mammillata TaxID=59560 RepID=A0A6F9D865_9ASCI|nr:bile acid-CoA:amino acid N-acyltransferase [Phallusia mammillata]